MVKAPYPNSARTATAASSTARRERVTRGSTRSMALPSIQHKCCIDGRSRLRSNTEVAQMSTHVRYIVNSTSDLRVYELLGFRVVVHPGPGFAALERDGVKLFLNVPGGGGGAGQPVAGAMPEP